MRRYWPYLRLLAGVAILGALVARLGSGAVVDGLRAIDIGAVLAALGIGLLTTVSSAWRWCLVARGLGLTFAVENRGRHQAHTEVVLREVDDLEVILELKIAWRDDDPSPLIPKFLAILHKVQARRTGRSRHVARG